MDTLPIPQASLRRVSKAVARLQGHGSHANGSSDHSSDGSSNSNLPNHRSLLLQMNRKRALSESDVDDLESMRRLQAAKLKTGSGTGLLLASGPEWFASSANAHSSPDADDNFKNNAYLSHARNEHQREVRGNKPGGNGVTSASGAAGGHTAGSTDSRALTVHNRSGSKESSVQGTSSGGSALHSNESGRSMHAAGQRVTSRGDTNGVRLHAGARAGGGAGPTSHTHGAQDGRVIKGGSRGRRGAESEVHPGSAPVPDSSSAGVHGGVGPGMGDDSNSGEGGSSGEKSDQSESLSPTDLLTEAADLMAEVEAEVLVEQEHAKTAPGALPVKPSRAAALLAAGGHGSLGDMHHPGMAAQAGAVMHHGMATEAAAYHGVQVPLIGLQGVVDHSGMMSAAGVAVGQEAAHAGQMGRMPMASMMTHHGMAVPTMMAPGGMQGPAVGMGMGMAMPAGAMYSDGSAVPGSGPDRSPLAVAALDAMGNPMQAGGALSPVPSYIAPVRVGPGMLDMRKLPLHGHPGMLVAAAGPQGAHMMPAMAMSLQGIEDTGMDHSGAVANVLAAPAPSVTPHYTSKFRGVYWRSRAWCAQIQHIGRKLYLGTYETEEEAARAYDAAARKYHGTAALTNFDTTGKVIEKNLVSRTGARDAVVGMRAGEGGAAAMAHVHAGQYGASMEAHTEPQTGRGARGRKASAAVVAAESAVTAHGASNSSQHASGGRTKRSRVPNARYTEDFASDIPSMDPNGRGPGSVGGVPSLPLGGHVGTVGPARSSSIGRAGSVGMHAGAMTGGHMGYGMMGGALSSRSGMGGYADDGMGMGMGMMGMGGMGMGGYPTTNGMGGHMGMGYMIPAGGMAESGFYSDGGMVSGGALAGGAGMMSRMVGMAAGNSVNESMGTKGSKRIKTDPSQFRAAAAGNRLGPAAAAGTHSSPEEGDEEGDHRSGGGQGEGSDEYNGQNSAMAQTMQGYHSDPGMQLPNAGGSRGGAGGMYGMGMGGYGMMGMGMPMGQPPMSLYGMQGTGMQSSSSTSGRYEVQQKLTDGERARLESFVTSVMTGKLRMSQASLVTDLAAWMSTAGEQPLDFYATLVARRRLNIILHPYLVHDGHMTGPVGPAHSGSHSGHHGGKGGAAFDATPNSEDAPAPAAPVPPASGALSSSDDDDFAVDADGAPLKKRSPNGGLASHPSGSPAGSDPTGQASGDYGGAEYDGGSVGSKRRRGGNAAWGGQPSRAGSGAFSVVGGPPASHGYTGGQQSQTSMANMSMRMNMGAYMAAQGQQQQYRGAGMPPAMMGMHVAYDQGTAGGGGRGMNLGQGQGETGGRGGSGNTPPE